MASNRSGRALLTHCQRRLFFSLCPPFSFFFFFSFFTHMSRVHSPSSRPGQPSQFSVLTHPASLLGTDPKVITVVLSNSNYCYRSLSYWYRGITHRQGSVSKGLEFILQISIKTGHITHRRNYVFKLFNVLYVAKINYK